MNNVLQKTREAAGMTQEDLAEKVGITRQTISSIERGKSEPSITNAKALAQVLNASLREGSRIDWKEFYD